MRINRHYRCILSFVLAVALSGCNESEIPKEVAYNQENVVGTETKYETKIKVYEGTTDKVVAHAMGEKDGMFSTNSLEAFKSSYDKGIRYFEVDFFNTADHRIVAVHDWIEWFDWLGRNIDDSPYRSVSHSDFMAQKIAGKYTPLDVESVAQLMIEYPDIYVITDTKRLAIKYYRDDISRLYMSLELAQEGLSERLIVQAYNEVNIEEARKLLPDKNIIFTAYMSGLDSGGIAKICENYPDLYAITVEKEKITPEIIDAANKACMKLYTHTINSNEDWESILEKGVYGFYSDDLSIELTENAIE